MIRFLRKLFHSHIWVYFSSRKGIIDRRCLSCGLEQENTGNGYTNI